MTARYELLAKLIKDHGWKRGAEIGVFAGRTHLYLMENCPDLELIGVDVWDLPGFSEGKTKSGEKCYCAYCNETREDRRAFSVAQMKQYILDARDPARSTIMCEPSASAARRVENGSLDFCFIDGDHSAEGCQCDILNWRPKVKLGGMIIGHDYNMKSVRDAVQAQFPVEDIIEGDDHVWMVPL